MGADRQALSRRSFVRAAGAALALGALGALPVRGSLADGAAQPDGDAAQIEGEGTGVRFRASVSGLGTDTLDLSFEVEVAEKDKAAPSITVTLRPKDADGFYLDDVRVGLDLGGVPLAYCAPRAGIARVGLGEPASSVDLVGVEAELIDAAWSGSGVSVYVLLEEPKEKSNDLTLLVAAGKSGAKVSQLVLHASVFDASGTEMGTPSLEVVPEGGEALELAPSAVVRASLPWREGAAGWEVTGADVVVEGGDATYAPGSFPTVEFGTYPQGKNGEVEPIEWYMLEERDGKQLLLAKHVLDAQPYNEEYTDVTWETCTLRAWLNSDFIKEALSADEQARVAEVELENPDNPDYGTPGGNKTKDRVFCLSLDEAMGHFGVGRTWKQLYDELGDDWYRDADGNVDYGKIYAEEPGYEALVAYATDYAVSRGAYVWENEEYDDYDGGSSWWLRSPGFVARCAALVDPVGFVISFGFDVDDADIGVRPALWLNL